MPGRRRRGHALGKELKCEIGPARRRLDLADIAAHEAGGAADRREKDPFLPHFAFDAVGQPRIESRVLHDGIELRRPRRWLTTEFAISQILQFHELSNAASLIDDGRHLAYASDQR